MDQRSYQMRQNEQGSPPSLTGHSAPGGLPPGSSDFFSPGGYPRSEDMDALSNFHMADHRGSFGFGQAMFQEPQRAGGAALIVHDFIKDPNTPWDPVKLGHVNYNAPPFNMPRETTGPSEYDESVLYGSSRFESVVDPSVTSVTDFSYTDAASNFDTRSVVGNLSNLQLQNSQNQNHERLPAPSNPRPRDAWSQQRLPSQEPPATLLCPGCNTKVKTKAELNKHKARHDKPHTCQEPGCARKVGFGTPNDLLRHQQSVHGYGGIKYRCSEGNCDTKPKDWPRADNFKQHLKRMHQIDLGSDPDLSKYERTCPSVATTPSQSQTKRGMLSSSLWMGLDQSQSALLGPSERETNFRQQEDRAMHVSQELQQLPGPQEMEARHGHAPLPEITETHHGGQYLLEEERPAPLEMDDTILRGLADQTHAEALTPATSDDSFSLEGGSICPAALTSTPARVTMQDDLGPYHQPDVANHQIQGSPHVQDSHFSGHADIDHPGQDSVEFESQDAADEDSSCDTPSEDEDTDGLHAFSESNASRDESTRHDQDEAKARREELYQAVVPPSKDTADAMDIDQASAYVRSLHEKGMLGEILSQLHEKGMLGEILSQLGIQTTKEDDEDKDIKEKPQSDLSSYAREHCPDCKKTFNRPCELRKHRKRHEKPYACTQEDCGKKFGSKNDWKRHENNQHSQLEFWRCTEKAAPGRRACSKVCHRRESFAKHLTQAHGVTDAALEKRCVDAFSSRNFTSLFWCGFCRQSIAFKDEKKDEKVALSERFDHIDAHFTGKDGRPKTDISEWKSLETEPPGTFLDILGEPREPEEPEEPMTGKRARDGDADDDAPGSGSRKRRYVKLGPRDALLWICCDCGQYWSHAVTTQCLGGGGCSHKGPLCSECTFVVQDTSDVVKVAKGT